MEYTKKCKNCEKEYTAQRRTSKFCSTACRVAYNRRKPDIEEIGIQAMQLVRYLAIYTDTGTEEQKKQALHYLERIEDRANTMLEIIYAEQDQ